MRKFFGFYGFAKLDLYEMAFKTKVFKNCLGKFNILDKCTHWAE